MADGEGPAQPVFRRSSRRRRVEGGRQHRHEVKVTAEEEAVLLRLANEQHVSVPRLLVEAALSGGSAAATVRRDLVTQLFSVERLLASISNNVNQIARATNWSQEVQAETAATLAAVRRVAERIEDTLEALSGPAGVD